MICAWCGSEAESTECGVCGKPPLLWERYRLQARLGKRGASTTFEAFDTADDRNVVVKELLLRAVSDAKELELFEREAKLLERIDHPGVPRFLDHFEWARGKQLGLYIVQEYLEGESLEQELGHRRPSEEDVARAMADVLEVLEALRELRVVHRDIKPANLLRTEDGIALVDFGAGRAVAESIYRAGSTVTGTFGYMAPEQMLAQAVPASDVYGLGATAVRMLTGKDPSELIAEHGALNWRAAAPNVSVQLAGVVDAMLVPNADDRPSDLDDLCRELRAFADGDASALTEYRGSTTLARVEGTELQRLTRRQALDEVIRFSGFGLAATAVCTCVTLLFLMPLIDGVIDLFPLVVALTIVTGVVAVNAGIRLRRVQRHTRIARLGTAVPALVRRRFIDDGDFMIDVEHRVGDERCRTRHPVSEERFLDLAEGDEVIVFAEPTDPTTVVVANAGLPALIPRT